VAGRAGDPGRAIRPGSGARYGLLLLVLISTYLLSAFSSSKLVDDLQVGLFVAVLLLALRTLSWSRRSSMLIGVVALIGSAAAFAASVGGTDVGVGASEL
jgi:hypothetical protein